MLVYVIKHDFFLYLLLTFLVLIYILYYSTVLFLFCNSYWLFLFNFIVFFPLWSSHFFSSKGQPVNLMLFYFIFVLISHYRFDPHYLARCLIILWPSVLNPMHTLNVMWLMTVFEGRWTSRTLAQPLKIFISVALQTRRRVLLFLSFSQLKLRLWKRVQRASLAPQHRKNIMNMENRVNVV